MLVAGWRWLQSYVRYSVIALNGPAIDPSVPLAGVVMCSSAQLPQVNLPVHPDVPRLPSRMDSWKKWGDLFTYIASSSQQVVTNVVLKVPPVDAPVD